jgi:hypothetical protein
MRPLSRFAVALALPVLLLGQSGTAAAAPVSAMFSGIMTDSSFDFLGAFGPADADLAGVAMHTTIAFDTTLPYSSGGSDVLYDDATPASGAITISVSIGGVTLTQSSTFGGLLQAIGMGNDTEAFGDVSDAPGAVLGYTIASATIWSAGMMDTSAAFETLLAGADPNQVQYLLVGAAPGQWEYLPFTVTDPQIIPPNAPFFARAPEIIGEPAGWRLLPVGLLALGIVRRRPSRACRAARQFRQPLILPAAISAGRHLC